MKSNNYAHNVRSFVCMGAIMKEPVRKLSYQCKGKYD